MTLLLNKLVFSTCCYSNQGSKMAESETLSIDTSTENQEDPLQDLSDEQIYQLLEETL